MALIINDVGANARNNYYDVKVVQGLLKEARYSTAVDGKVGRNTLEAIKSFQRDKLGLREPDAVIDANSRSVEVLSRFATRQYYLLNDNDITIGQLVIPKLKELAIHFYYSSNGMVPVITSGTRTAQQQASAMFIKLHDEKENITRLYKRKAAVKQIVNKYQELLGHNKTKAEIIAGMAQVITSQISQGIYISRHLIAGAVDIRSRNLTLLQKKHMINIARRYAVKILDETKPPHFHLEF
jgi:hypothetical protein